MNNANDVRVADEIARLERARCRALVEADLATLGELVADDVVHVHANGKTDDKPTYLAAVSTQIRFLSATREGLDVRVYGDIAVATGPLRQSIELMPAGQRMEMSIMTTQVWRRQMNAWQQVSFQATNL
ncbi:nuclear transport factor 2 family protein [Paraburkholderia pallida]|uniref:Nuclear transport factor 2 family protein n=1 Tax=Paraburkholderia pallida TaxID=2547399 RepID=A0A4P7CS78_9BURK|nr:nuclear transport factor 2 family protein [Paraburkholderia pallida]QBQ98745.1 nuclear transport factor 2 family protein [Paraburkholderia pallida]